VRRSSDANEFCELDRILGSVGRCKHITFQVKEFVAHPAVWIKKWFHMFPGALDCVRTSASTHTNETDLVFHSFVFVAEPFSVRYLGQQSQITVEPCSF
jgi:hypothetical protein